MGVDNLWITQELMWITYVDKKKSAISCGLIFCSGILKMQNLNLLIDYSIKLQRTMADNVIQPSQSKHNNHMQT